MSIFHFVWDQCQRKAEFLHLVLKEKHYFKTCRLMKKALRDHCLVFFPAHLGETFLVFSNIERIEKEKKVKIMPVIRPSHVVVAKMCSCREYIVCRSVEAPFIFLPILLQYKCITVKMFYKKIIPELKTGTLFLAYPSCYDSYGYLFLQNEVNSMTTFLGIFLKMHDFRMSQQNDLLPLSQNYGYKYEKMVVLCPEAKSCSLFSRCFWEDLANRCKGLGYDTYCNAQDSSYFLRNAKHLNHSFQDIVGICQRAAFVISIRSGLCDLLANKGSRLIVLYQDNCIMNLMGNDDERLNRNFYRFFSLNTLFRRNDIPEFVFPLEKPDSSRIADYIRQQGK